VEEVSGTSDFGEDLRVTFSDGRERTGYIVSIQVKSGRSLRGAHGYRVPIGHHSSNWAESNLPVACVVHDPEKQSFFWANASKQLRHAKLTMHEIRSIAVSNDSPLNEANLPTFVAEMRGYIDGSRDIANAIEELAAVVIDPRDYVAYAPNIFDERMAFIQPFGADHALLIHDDFKLHPIEITMESLALPGSKRHGELIPHELLENVPLLNDDIILNMEEATWIVSCFLNSRWHRGESVAGAPAGEAEPDAEKHHDCLAQSDEEAMVDGRDMVDPERSEDEILRRIERRITGSRAYGQRSASFHDDPVPVLEQFVVHRHEELFKDIWQLGFARNRATRPIIETAQRNFEELAPILQGYIAIGVHMNNLAIGKWRRRGRPRVIVEALAQIHARSLLVADEVFTLLYSGYPAGAQALSRTLYELGIVAKFIAAGPAVLARRYLLSHIVEMHRRQGEERSDRIDELDPQVRGVWAELDRRYARIIATHGEEMGFVNGWAWPTFATQGDGRPRKRKSITFADIEERVNETERKWRYKSASHYVHAVHLGTVKSLVTDTPGHLVLGPRPVGFAEPATDCLWDLHEVVETFLRAVHRSSRDPEVLYWLEVQTLAVTAMHVVVNERALGHPGFE
jgi:Family of unknown function (DUF5677)/Domain of unknown function (DUF4365)